MSSGLGKWRKQTLAGIFATPVALSVVQQSSTVSADESMTWWLAKNVLRFTGMAVITYAAKKVTQKILGSNNKSEAVQPVILLVNTKGKNHVGFVNKKTKTKTKNKLNYNESSKKVTNVMELFRNDKKKRNENEKKPLYEGFLMKEKFLEIVEKEIKKDNLNFMNSEINYFREITKDIRNIKEKFINMQKYREALKNKKIGMIPTCSDLFFVINKDGSFEAFYYDAEDNKKVLFLHKNSPIRKLIKTEFGNMEKMKKDENVYSVEKGIIISKVKTKAEKDEMEKELKELSNDRSAENNAELKKSKEELSKELKDLENELDNEEAMKQEEFNKKISEDYEKLGKEVYQEENEKLKEYENKINSGIKYVDDLLESTGNNLVETEKGFNKAYEDVINDFEILGGDY
jgi:hypothetical protein